MSDPNYSDPIDQWAWGAWNWVQTQAGNAKNTLQSGASAWGDIFSTIQEMNAGKQAYIDYRAQQDGIGPIDKAVTHKYDDEWAKMSPTQRAQWIQKVKDQKKQEEEKQQAAASSAAQPSSSKTLTSQLGASGSGSIYGLTTLGAGSGNALDGTMPMPWDPNMYPVQMTNPFDPSSGEDGEDFAMPGYSGVALSTPLPGKVRIEYANQYANDHNDPRGGWGNRVLVDVYAQDGTTLIGTYAIGHLASINGDVIKAAATGTFINAGTVIGQGGQGWTGHGDGPHIEMQWYDANGNPVNPAQLWQELFTGKMTYNTFLTQVGTGTTSGLGGMGSPSGGPPTSFYTSDGRVIGANDPMMKYYQMLMSSWRASYGTAPPYWALQLAQQNNVQDITTANQFVGELPSNIEGMTNAQRDAYYKMVQGAAEKYLGYDVPETFLEQLAAQGLTNPTEIDAYFAHHPAAEVPHANGQLIQKAVTSSQMNRGGQGATPDQVKAIHDQSNAYTNNDNARVTVGSKPI